MKKVIIILIISVIIFFILSKKFNFKKIGNMQTFKDAMIIARQKYDKAICDNAERIFRLESNHFKSEQFKQCLSPGMEKFSNTYPYGWGTLKKYVWDKHPEYKPIGLKTFTENGTGKQKTFVVFGSMEASLLTLCEFLKIYGNNAGRWFSLNLENQQAYNKKIAGINPSISNAIA